MARQMKDSGFAWIGKIPVDWNIQKVKTAFYRSKEEAHIEDPVVLSLARSGVKIRDISTNEGQLAESYYNYNPVIQGDLLLNPMDLYSGANCSVSNVEGVISPAYINLRRKGDYSPNFYDYYFKTQYWAMALFAHGKGVSFDNRWTLSPDDLFNYTIPVPSYEEQLKIASFLDEKCSEIDAVIAKTTATIEEYKKLKQSIITDAVTKGVRGYRSMKDSGVEWIGAIPANWNRNSIKNVATTCSGGTPNSSDETLYDGDINWMCSYDLREKPIYESGRKITQKGADDIAGKLQSVGSILVAMYGGAGTIGNSGILECEARTNQAICSIKFDNDYILDYYGFYYILAIRKYWMIYAVGTRKDPNISQDIVKRMPCIIPPIDEQKEIINFLDKKCSEMDVLIEKKTALLEEMETYKKSVIYEYVTGKKEVASESTQTVALIYPYFPSVLATNKPRFAQAVLMSKILDSNVSNMGRVKLEKMLFTIEHSLGFDFDTEYSREAAGPLDSSIYECERVISRANKWFYINSSKYGVSYKPQGDMSKYKKYYEQYFSEYNEEIERIINVFRNYSLDQAEIVATLYGAWNDFIIDNKEFTDEDIVNDVLNNWNDSKKRFSKDIWLRAIESMRKNNLVPKGYGKHTVTNPNS